MTDNLFFDTDCLSAFLWIRNINILHELYGGRIILPEPVYTELSRPSIPHIKSQADLLIHNGDATIKNIEYGTEEYMLYSKLKKGGNGRRALGSGEASGIALAKTYNGILASNNYRDIAPYIKEYNLRHVDTGMILKEALEKRLITEEEGNAMWQKMLNKNRILPAKSFSEYLKR